MNILLYKGQSQYGVLRFFIDEMAGAFVKFGHNVTVIDLEAEDWPVKMDNALSQYNVLDFVFSFNAIGIDVKEATNSGQTKKLLHDQLNVPFVAALVDHPGHHLLRLNTQLNHLLVNCIDESHLDFLASYYPAGHIKLKAVLPQAGTSAAPFGEESWDEYLKKRTIPLLFAGSILTPVKKWQNLSLDKSIVKLLDDIVDYVLANDCMNLENAYTYVMAERGLQLDREQQQKIYLLLYYSVYYYIWGYCRQQVLKTLAKAQVPLTVYGDAGGYLEKYKTVTFIGKRPYVQLLLDLQQARLSLNTTTFLRSGASERVFSSMLNGAVSVSQANHSKALIDGENCVLYQWRKLDELPGKIFNLLENPEAAWQIAQNAAKLAETKHLWLHRAQQVLESVSLYQSLYNL